MDGMKKGQDAVEPYRPGDKTPAQKAAIQTAAASSIAAGQQAANTFLKGEKQPILGSFKEGGIVPKTGAYKLHAGEKVTPMANEEKMAEGLATGTKGKAKPAAKAAAKKETKPVVHHMSIHKVNGGHVVHHHHAPHEEGDGRKPDATHVVPNGPGGEGDMDPLHAHIEQHMGAPNAGEDGMAEGAAPAMPAGGAAPQMANLQPPPATA